MFSKFKKKEKFFIMCHQRSGSNMFTSQLNGHPDVSHFGQLFKGKGDVIGKLKNMGVVEFEGVSFVDDNDERTRFDQLEKHPEKREKRNTKEFIDSFYKNYGKFAKTSRVGMKFHGGTMYQDEIEDILLNDDYKVIILYRENLVKAAISWYQARDTNKWVQVGQENKDAAEVVENFDVEEMEFFINNVKRDIAQWKKMVKDSGVNSMILTYEQVTDPSFNFTDVWNFLGVKDVGNTKPITKKLIKSYDHIKNLQEIREKLNSEENGMV